MALSINKILDPHLATSNQKKDKIGKRFIISEQTICQSILKAFSDNETSKILNALIKNPHTILEVLEKLDIPKTSGYRKFNALIDEGLLIQIGNEITTNRRKINKYKTLFQNVNIDFGNKVKVIVQFQQDIPNNNSILQIDHI